MTASRTYNVYCDESCHLENDRLPVMAWGGVICEAGETLALSNAIRDLKERHGLARTFEAKWTKVSPGKLSFYQDLVALYLSDDRLRFRGLLVPDKSVIDHAAFDQSHDDWYYKMYYVMLRFLFCAPHRYRIYLDVKDTRGGPKTRHLHDVLANSLHDFQRETVERVQQVRSDESELLQLADVILGAVTYANRRLTTSPAKLALVQQLQMDLGAGALTHNSAFAATKFNILKWKPKGAT